MFPDPNNLHTFAMHVRDYGPDRLHGAPLMADIFDRLDLGFSRMAHSACPIPELR